MEVFIEQDAIEVEQPMASSVAPVDIAFKMRIAMQRKIYDEDIILDREGEVECAKAIEAGLFARDKLEASVWAPDYQRDLEAVADIGTQAYERLVMSGLLFARSVAYEKASVATRQNMPMSDVVGAATEALMKSVQRWDYARGNRLLTFAAPTIRGHVTKFIAAQRTGNRRDMERLVAFSRTREELTHRDMREPSNNEVVTALGWSNDQYGRYVRASRVENIDAPIGTEGRSLGEVMEAYGPTPEEWYEQSELSWTIDRILGTLESRERCLMVMRYGLDGNGCHTQREIGERLGISQMQVSRIESRILKELAHDSVIKELGRLFLGADNKKDA